MLNFKSYILRNFPRLGKIKRYFLGCIDFYLPQMNYSQHGEDVVIWELLEKSNFKNGIYVDVGANHPTSISNTYKLYRKGLDGICIEPNPELIWLHKKFRKKDIQIQVGCGETADLLVFKNYNIPVLSGFGNDTMVKHRDLKIVSQALVPVLPLDTIIEPFNPPLISILSIDVEGMDFQVLKGAKKTLLKTYLVCIEIDNTNEKEKITDFLKSFHFEPYKEIACNLIFMNKKTEAFVL